MLFALRAEFPTSSFLLLFPSPSTPLWSWGAVWGSKDMAKLVLGAQNNVSWEGLLPRSEEIPVADNTSLLPSMMGTSEVSKVNQLRAQQSQILSCLTPLSWGCKLALPCAFRL